MMHYRSPYTLRDPRWVAARAMGRSVPTIGAGPSTPRAPIGSVRDTISAACRWDHHQQRWIGPRGECPGDPTYDPSARPRIGCGAFKGATACRTGEECVCDPFVVPQDCWCQEARPR